MSIARRLSGFVHCHSLLPVALVALAGLGSSAAAQTAPQLLPYTSKLVAGGGKVAIPATVGATCPSSGLKTTDIYGDGCLATEIQLVGPRYAVADINGNIFVSDYTNGLIRRVDAITGIVTAIAGGAAASPTAGTTCGALVSTDIKGNGCLATAVKLKNPADLRFSAAGDLYFGDVGYGIVRKIAATGGVITTTGVITMVNGQQGTATSGTFGYASNFGTTNIVAATGGYTDDPYGLAFDANGNLFIADEGTNAVVVVNINATATTTVTGVSIPAGTVAKIIGSPTGGGSVCPNGSVKPFGCNFGRFTSGASANSSQTDAPYAVAVDPAGNVFFANEFLNSVGKVVPAGTISLYAGTNSSTSGSSLVRAPAGSFAMGTDFGLAADANSNVYVTDAYNGVIWRIDGATQSQYVVAGGATSTCAAATDSFGNGCPALQSTFGSLISPKGGFATAGVFGVSVDANANLYVGDTVTNIIREVSSGTQFGTIGANQPTDIVEIHFAKGDSPAASAYSLTAGAANFSLGTASCTANTDATTDCLLPIKATPAALGPFAGTLQVKSTLGAVATFPLSGVYVSTPITRIGVSANPAGCAGNTTFTNTTPVTLTAAIGSSGTPTGTVTFFANGTQIGTPATVANSGATLTFTFAAPGTYAITATYSGDANFNTSTTTSATSIVSVVPTFTMTPTTYVQNTVKAGQTALYSFNIAATYIGSIAFSCSGLPASSSCAFSPQSMPVANGCPASSTVALNIITRVVPTTLQNSLVVGRGPWATLTALSGMGLALLIGLRRRRTPLRYGQLWMALALLLAASGVVACSNGISPGSPTPTGTYNITVTATGSAGVTSSVPIQLTVN